MLCWVFFACASSSPLQAAVLCVVRVTRFARPTCRASALPLEERRHVFHVLQKLPLETNGEEAKQGPKKPAEGAAAGAEVSAGGDGGRAGEQVRSVVPQLFARHARMVLLCLWIPPRHVLRGSRVLRVTFVLIVALLGRIAPCFPCSADACASEGGAPRLPGTSSQSGRSSTYGDGSRGQDERTTTSRNCRGVGGVGGGGVGD